MLTERDLMVERERRKDLVREVEARRLLCQAQAGRPASATRRSLVARTMAALGSPPGRVGHAPARTG